MSASSSSSSRSPAPAPAIERLKLLIAYDGAPFEGWQSQARGNTVQDHIERAFETICGARVALHGSGRTDTGVHALGQVAHADVPTAQLTAEKWRNALNAHLPGAIRILRIKRAPSNFHARFQARGKIYLYRIWNAPVFHPFERGRAWHLPAPLDLETLRSCAQMLEGTHDFAGFAANRRERENAPSSSSSSSLSSSSSVRSMRRIDLHRRGALLTLRFEADGFLYKMVRLITGTLVRCGQGRMQPEKIRELLTRKGERKTSFAAPPDGLYLVRVLY